MSSNPVDEQTMAQLNEARLIALGDAAHYSRIVPYVLPIISPNRNPSLNLRRWGADFLAETFASPSLASEQKQKLSLVVLGFLKEYLERATEDASVIKSLVQAAASVYPLVFRYMVNNPTDSSNWETITAIKSNILQRMDSNPPGVRICCIKFVQKVVQTQTQGPLPDPRRPEQNDISLVLVPKDHPLMPPHNLEAEASGLLDRLLSILQEESDALLVTATLNSLGSLIRTRASISNKIIASILNYNPMKLANSPMTPKSKVMIKSMERTTRSLLINVLKKNPEHPLNPRIQSYIERMHRMRVDVFDEVNRKRPAPVESVDGLDAAKRQRLGAELPSQPLTYPELPPGPVSHAQLFTLTQDEGSKAFDVQVIPIDLLVRILVPILSKIDKGQMDHAINAVRARYLSLGRQQAQSAVDANAAITGRFAAPEEDEDYEPDYEPTEDAEQIATRLENAPPEDVIQFKPPEVNLGLFKLPSAPALTEQQIQKCSSGTIVRIFDVMTKLYERGKAKKPGFNRVAASNYDRDAWVTVMARLASRGAAGLEGETVKPDPGPTSLSRKGSYVVGETIRDALYLYIIEDFRGRVDVAITWLAEEWYNEQVQLQTQQPGTEPFRNYKKWVLKLLDGMLPYLDAKDKKVLLRFLSEIPEMDADVLERVKRIAKDPERVSLAVNGLHYLIMLRPPVREICIDALEDLWRNYHGAKGPTAKLLGKWRPHVLEEVANGVTAE